MDLYNNTKITSQEIYDYYNGFIFSDNNIVFNKMVKKIELYNEIKELVGDIVEFGVFKGSGIALWLKLKELNEPYSITRILGFDFFEPTTLLEQLENNNKEMMEIILNRVDHNDLTLDNVTKQLKNFNKENYLLIKGDAVEECNNYYNTNLGARIKLLYMDLDLGDPTYKILKILWDKVVINGIIVFDEYGYHKWDESDGVDMFLKEIEGKYELYNTKIYTPTMYIKKISY